MQVPQHGPENEENLSFEAKISHHLSKPFLISFWALSMLLLNLEFMRIGQIVRSQEVRQYRKIFSKNMKR